MAVSGKEVCLRCCVGLLAAAQNTTAGTTTLDALHSVLLRRSLGEAGYGWLVLTLGVRAAMFGTVRQLEQLFRDTTVSRGATLSTAVSCVCALGVPVSRVDMGSCV
eukprot:662430-Rhodomonas_salina.1